LAEAFDRGEDFVGGFCPTIGLWIFVVALDEGMDVDLQLLYRSMDAAPELLSGQLCEPPLDLIDPGG
jgi:hypothetical protein